MATCANGHENAEGQKFCGECGAVIPEPARSFAVSAGPRSLSRRRRWLTVRRNQFIAGGVAAAVVVLVLILVLGGGGSKATSNAANSGTSPDQGPSLTTPTTTSLAGGSITQPLPVGSPTTTTNGWKMTLGGFNANATGAVVSFNQFNDQPPPGMHYASLNVHAEWTGVGTGNPFSAPSVNLIGALKTSYQPKSVAGGSGGDPHAFSDQAAAPPGGAIDGTLYYLVADNDSGLVAWFPTVSFNSIPGGVGYVAIQ